MSLRPTSPGRSRPNFPGGICPASGRSLFKSKTGLGTSNHLVVNDDVDVGNLKEVVCAFATRNYPGASGELTFHDETTSPLVSFLYDSEKMSMGTTKVLYNCLPPEGVAWQPAEAPLLPWRVLARLIAKSARQSDRLRLQIP